MLGKRLKKLRLDKDMTQQKLADYLHVSPGSIGMWEHDRREPDIDMLIKLADLYGVSVDFLIGHETANVTQAAIDEAIQLMELATQKLKDNAQE